MGVGVGRVSNNAHPAATFAEKVILTPSSYHVAHDNTLETYQADEGTVGACRPQLQLLLFKLGGIARSSQDADRAR